MKDIKSANRGITNDIIRRKGGKAGWEAEGADVSPVLQGPGGSGLQGGTASLKSLLLTGQLLSTGLLLLRVDLG